MINILQGDCRDILPTLPEQSIQAVITSPPYYGLRDYGVDGQLGLEESPDAYVAALVAVFREVRRVLRDDGVLWLNLGDSYAAPSKWGGASGGKNYTSAAGGYPRARRGQRPLSGRAAADDVEQPRCQPQPGLKDKDLIGIPWMVAFALRADGWYLRSDCIWAKPNVMPESVTDRPTRCHEYLFLLSKSRHYFYDAAAIAEPPATSSQDRAHLGHRPISARQQAMQDAGMHGQSDSLRIYDRITRNRRTVWTIPTQPYRGAHFAAFPEALVEPCILAGSSAYACGICGAPWQRTVEPTGHVNKRESAHVPGNTATKVDSTGWQPMSRPTNCFEPTCKCKNDGSGRCVVLDPFAGSGTTLCVAERLGRKSIGIELNPAYVDLQEHRTDGVQLVSTDLLT